MDKARVGWYCSIATIAFLIISTFFLLAITIKKTKLLSEMTLSQQITINHLEKNISQLTSALTHLDKQFTAQKVDRDLIYAKQLVETAYLNILLSQDAYRSMILLKQAYAALENKPAYMALAKKINDKIIKLEFAAKMNRENIAFELDALKNVLHDLPFKIEPFETKPVVAEAHPTFNQFLAKLKDIVVIRRVEQPIQPLLKPEQKIYLDQNLYVLFDQAQFALWQRNEKLYQYSLQSIKKLVEQYFVMNRTETKLFIDKIDALLKVDIAPELPNLNDLVVAFEP